MRGKTSFFLLFLFLLLSTFIHGITFRPEEGGRPFLSMNRDARAGEWLARLPRGFVENQGQWAFPARFVARFPSMNLFLERRGWTLAMERRQGERVEGVGLRMTFQGGNPAPSLVPEDPLPGLHHFILGKDPSLWRRNVPWFRSVRYEGIYPGVDIRVRGKKEEWEYDLLLAPGAALSQVGIRIQGAQGLRLEDDGTLVIETGLGEIRQPPPRAWEETGGKRRPLLCRYRLLGSDTFGFVSPGRDPRLAMVVDPLVFSTFIGGNSTDLAFDLAVDSLGNTTVVGETASSDYPVRIGSYDTTFNGWIDAFVTRLSPDGSSLVFSTFLGGSGADFAVACSVDSAGVVTLAGETRSSDFPTTTGAFDTSYNGGDNDGDTPAPGDTGGTAGGGIEPDFGAEQPLPAIAPTLGPVMQDYADAMKNKDWDACWDMLSSGSVGSWTAYATLTF